MVGPPAKLGDFEVLGPQGLNPSLITVTAAEFQGVLTRSKTIGADKNIQSRPVVISCCCYVKVPSWLQVGWKLLSRLAAFDRDFLWPSPSSNLAGCLQTELRYDTGFAMMNRLLAAIPLSGDVKIQPAIAHFWDTALWQSLHAQFHRCSRFLQGRTELSGRMASTSQRQVRQSLKAESAEHAEGSGPDDPEK